MTVVQTRRSRGKLWWPRKTRISGSEDIYREHPRRRALAETNTRPTAPTSGSAGNFRCQKWERSLLLSQDAILAVAVLRTTLVIWRPSWQLNSSVSFNLPGCKSGKIVASSLFCEVIVEILRKTTLNREKKDRKPIRSWIYDNSVSNSIVISSNVEICNCGVCDAWI